jgi:hypothetical protein
VEGETRPTKPVKEKKKKRATGARTKSSKPEAVTNGTTTTSTKAKRQFDGTGLEVRNSYIVNPSATPFALGAISSRTDFC